MMAFGHVLGTTFIGEGDSQVLEVEGRGRGATPGIDLKRLPALGFCTASTPFAWSM